MATFYEQLRKFLEPRFQLGEELGHGGMGEVYLAQDTRLQRVVAIKAIPPEKASASALARFRFEARILAGLEHPNIVRIYDVAPESGPFTYYVMEHLPEGTLEQRLSALRRLAGPETAKLGRDVLEALDLAHRHRIVHRDIKPSNIFLQQGRWIVTDFGIAKSLDGDSSLTGPRPTPQTPRYGAPELTDGITVPQSDIYSTAMVLYEAVTGELWPKTKYLDAANWKAVPENLRRALRRGLAWRYRDRWRTARAFQRALSGRRSLLSSIDDLQRLARTKWGVAIVVAVATAVIGGLKVWKPVDIHIGSPEVAGDAPAGLGDSIARRLVSGLTGFPDFSVAGPGGRWRAKAVVSSSATVNGQALTVHLHLPRQLPIVVLGAVADWRTVSDLLADSVALRLYRGGPIESRLPQRVMPQTPTGMQAFFLAERAFARAWYDSAYVLYDRAADLDPTCVLCRWRHAEVGRFLSLPQDTADEAAYQARLEEFPPQYQALIRVELVPLRARLDSLDQINRRWPKFLFGRFRYADELIHRGPLVGRARREAALYFEQTIDLRHDFVPGWEHLLWLWIAEGDARASKLDLDTLLALAPRATTPVRDLLGGAFAWRFSPPPLAAQLTEPIIPSARARQEPVDAGARYLNAFDAQAGAVWLGAQLDSANDHRESALLAQLFGYLGLGRPQQAAIVQSRVVNRYGDPVVELFGLELEATQLMIDPDSTAPIRWVALAARLREFAQRAGVELRPRAEWMAALLTQHFARQSSILGRDVPDPLVALLNATETAGRGDMAGALARTVPLVEIESARVGDPFFRTILHFLRAEWSARLAQPYSADAELSWYENTDVIEYPTGAPQPSEVDWAFGVLARWRRLALTSVTDDRCRLARDVARLWADGEPRYAARADSARSAAAALRCSETGGGT